MKCMYNVFNKHKNKYSGIVHYLAILFEFKIIKVILSMDEKEISILYLVFHNIGTKNEIKSLRNNEKEFPKK